MKKSKNLKRDSFHEFDKGNFFEEIFSPDFPEIGDSSSYDDFYSDDLINYLKKSDKYFPQEDLSSVRQMFFNRGINNISMEHVQILLRRIRPIVSLGENGPLISLLQFLSEDNDFSSTIYLSNKLNSIDFSDFSQIKSEIQADTCLLIDQIINYYPESAESFFRTFFSYFVQNLNRNELYSSASLQNHLHLASTFIQYLKDDRTISILLSRFMLFIHHENTEIQSSCLEGILHVVTKQPDLLESAVFRDHNFIDRIFYLCRQQQETTGYLIFILFQHLLKKNIEYNDSFFINLCNLTTVYIARFVRNARIEAISLISYAFPNHYFVGYTWDNQNPQESPLLKLITTFIDNFTVFSLKEKKEAAFAVANFGFFVRIETVKYFFANTTIFDIFLSLLTLDQEEIWQPLLDGFYRVLQLSEREMLNDNQKTELHQCLIEMKEVSNEKLNNIINKYLSLSLFG